MSIFDWSTTASSNGNSDSSINFQENQAPSTLNDSARALMARVAFWRNWLGSSMTQGGASNAYTITSGESLSAYTAGMRFAWQPNADSTGSVTLNIDAIGAKKVYLPNGVQAASGDVGTDSVYDVVYQDSLDSASGGFKIVGFPDTTLDGDDYLAIANDLSDLNSASTARTNLGVGIGTDVQAHNAALDSLSSYPLTAAELQQLQKIDSATISTAQWGYLGATSGTIWTTDNDGAGSGLDADTVDGLHASTLAQLSASNTFTGGSQNLSNATPLLKWTETDAATDEKEWRQYAAGGDFYFTFRNDADSSSTVWGRVVRNGMTVTEIEFNATLFDFNGEMDVSGDVTATDFNISSDRRLKDNILDLENAPAIVQALRPVRFAWKRNGQADIGFIAQEVQAIIPEAVKAHTDGFLRLSPDKVIPYLVATVQHLQAEIAEMKGEDQ